MKIVIRYIFSFILLLLAQIFVLNNVNLFGIANPYLYVLFIIILPTNTPRYLLLMLAFFLGMFVDMFSNTLGVHAFSTVLAAFVRILAINHFIPVDEHRGGEQDAIIPSMTSIGVASFIKYSILVVVVHHVSLFFLEAFSFDNFLLTLLRIVCSVLFTLTLLLGIERIKAR